MKRSILLLLVLLSVFSLHAGALEVEAGSTHCFTALDFPQQDLQGVCITGLPDHGALMLGSRVVRSGDILTTAQLQQMTFQPLRGEEDQQVAVSYLPIFENKVGDAAQLTISIRGKEDKAPIAEDSALETYKNLPNSGTLKAKDPENSLLTYALVRAPRRGTVVLNADGSFTYTPKKNKVGVDSFTYTAADEGGKVSRQATVTITILKPADKQTYADTAGSSCRFTAEWMRNTGLFTGEKVGDDLCFQPEKTVSRGEFVTMLVKSLDLPVEEDAHYTGFTDDIPLWLRPYLAAALRSGMTAGWGDVFGAQEPISGDQAALLLQGALDVEVDTIPQAASLSRAQVAQVLYDVSKLAASTPGTLVFSRK